MRFWRFSILTLVATVLIGCSRSGQLIVQVLDGQSGEPIEGADVQVSNIYFIDLNPFKPRRQFAQTNSEGEAIFNSQFYNGAPVVLVHAAHYGFASTELGSFGDPDGFLSQMNSDRQKRAESMRQAWRLGEPYVDAYQVYPKGMNLN